MKTSTKILIGTGILFLVIFLVIYFKVQSFQLQKENYFKDLNTFCNTPYEINTSSLQENEIKPLRLAYLLRSESKGQGLTTYQISDLYTKCCNVMNLSCDLITIETNSEYQKIYSVLVNLKENDSRLVSFQSGGEEMGQLFIQFTYDSNRTIHKIK